MPVKVVKGAPGKYRIVEVSTGRTVATSRDGRKARIHAAIRNRHWLEKHMTTYKGKRGIWITLKSGRKIFIPEEKCKKYFRMKGYPI